MIALMCIINAVMGVCIGWIIHKYYGSKIEKIFRRI